MKPSFLKKSTILILLILMASALTGCTVVSGEAGCVRPLYVQPSPTFYYYVEPPSVWFNVDLHRGRCH